MINRLASDGLYGARFLIAPGSLLRKLLRSLVTAAYDERLCLISACTAGKMLPLGEHFGFAEEAGRYGALADRLCVRYDEGAALVQQRAGTVKEELRGVRRGRKVLRGYRPLHTLDPSFIDKRG